MSIWSQDLTDLIKKADIYMDSLKYDQAILFYQMSIEKAVEEQEDSLVSIICIKLGSAYLDLEKNSLGIKYYDRALSISKQKRDFKTIANANFGLAVAYQQKEVFDSAVIYYKKALAYFSQQNEKKTLSYLYSNISFLFHQTGNLDSTKYYSNKALELQMILEDNFGTGASLANLGMIEKKQLNFQEAADHYRKSIQFYQKENYLKGYSKSIRELGLIFYEMKEYDSAAIYFFTYDSLGHDLFHKDDQEKILELEARFKTTEIERDNAQNQSKIQRLYFLIGAIAFLTILSFFLLNQRRQRQKKANNQKIHDLLQGQEIKTAYALLEGQDQERKRIASELHDNLGSILTSLNMFSDAIQTKKDHIQIGQIANKISQTSRMANEEVRKISRSLDSGLLNHFGLEVAIKHLMEAIEISKDIQIELELQIIAELDNAYGLEIYRIIQELVNNTLKHADCSKIRLDISHINHEMSIIFNDNGKGFNPVNISKGMGLGNIRRRIEKLEGDFKIDSTIGKGTTFIIELSLV